MNNTSKSSFSKGMIVSIMFNIVLIIIVLFFALGNYIKFQGTANNSLVETETNEPTTTQKGALPSELILHLPAEFNLLNEAWDIINSDYVDKTAIDPEKLSQGAVRGMVEALGDRFSGYADPESYKREIESLVGKYQGIGAYVGIDKNKQIVILAPIKDSPAMEAGLKPGDVILKINDEETEGMTVEEAAALIKGPAGTSVLLKIRRENVEEPIDIKLIRREVKVQTVFYEIKDENIGYVQLTIFSQTSGDDLYAALNDLKRQQVKGLILDLRNNGGGMLDIAIDVVSQFQKNGTAVKLADKDGRTTAYSVYPFRFVTDLPLVILINQYSASASEIVSGTLQDYKRATLIGKATFGKGKAQIVRNLSDGSSIHITNSLWLTANGRQINDTGLEPDIVSELEDEELIEFAVNYLKGKN